MAVKNVWIDDAYDYSGQTLHYRVKMNGNAIEEGIASARDFPIRIYLNRVAQAYLESSFPEATGVTRDEGAYAEFSLVEMSGDTESTTLYTVTYVNAYSEAVNYSETVSRYLSRSINWHADPRQRLYFTIFNNSQTTITVE